MVTPPALSSKLVKAGRHCFTREMKAKKRVGMRTYLKLSAGIAILSGFNYVFTKLFELVYGNYDLGYAIGIGILVLLFIGGFTIYLQIVDRKGTIAQMLGMGADLWRIQYEKQGSTLEVTGSTKSEVEDLFFRLREKLMLEGSK